VPGTEGDEVEVLECWRGPVLVRGATSIRDVDGQAHRVARSVVALCRCARSSRAPWCDGTHKFLLSSGPANSVEIPSVEIASVELDEREVILRSRAAVIAT
jgi:CDGSH-type Zn-finger protein